MVEGSNGEDLWLMVNDGRIVGHVGSTMVKNYKGEVCEGFDNSWWGKCFNEDISNWENMGVYEQLEVNSAQEMLEQKATSLALVSGAGF